MILRFIGQEPEAARGLLTALRNSGVSVVYQDLALVILWAQNVPRVWSMGDVSGMTDSDFLPPDVSERVLAAKRAVLDNGAPQRFEISLPDKDGIRWFDLWIDLNRDENDTPQGVITTAVDITEQKRREHTLRALLREVSHRSKNLLAIIQSIATQTGRYSGTIDGFLSRFRGRIQSLASSQDLVTSSNWRGAGLPELVASQVARYSPAPQRAVRYEGARPWLNPNAALHVGLALHELAVNSVSYGALSKPGGFVTIKAGLAEGGDGKAALSLTWTESIAARDEPTVVEKRFGSVALERVVPASLNGSSTLSIQDDVLEYRLLIPFGNFEVE